MIDWFVFSVNFIFALLLLIAPGFICSFPICKSVGRSICIAPALTLLLFTFCGIVLSQLKLMLSPVIFLAVSVAASIAVGFTFCQLNAGFRSCVNCFIDSFRHGLANVFCWYIFVGAIFIILLFLLPISGPNSFSTTADAGPHLSYVRAFIESGTYSSLHVSNDPATIHAAGFYPASFHVFSAALTALPGCSVTMAVNIVTVLACSVIYPFASYLLLSRLFSSDSLELKTGALACLCNVGFPWAFLVWGQLDSNLLGFALVPIFIFAFWELLLPRYSVSLNSRIVFVISCGASLALAQPNAVFTAGIFCIPLIIHYTTVWYAGKYNQGMQLIGLRKSLICGCQLLAIALVWIAVYRMPAMHGVVTFDWPNDATVVQAAIAAIFLKYGGMLQYQFLLAPFVLHGLYIAFKSDRFRPVAFLYLFVSFLFIASYTKGFPFQSLFSGFWYNDFYRMGAMTAMASAPLLCLSFASIFNLLNSADVLCSGRFLRVIPAVASLIFVAILIHPSIQLPDGSWFDTPFGSIESGVERTYAKNNVEGIDFAEWDFIEECQKIVKNDAVINVPFDGSGMLYGATGMNVVYRNISAKHGQFQETEPIRLHLSDISMDASVRDMVSALNARYVLILDYNSPNGSIVPYAYHPREAWEGILDINENTPGFELVLSREDMRLFRIK